MRIDEQENIFNNDILLGKLNGFIFNSTENFEPSDVVDNFITEAFVKKIDKLLNEGDAALRLNEHFHLTYNDAVIAKLLPTDDVFKPDFTPILDDRIQGIALARLALHLESWLKRQLNAVCDPLDIIAKTEDLTPESIDFIKVITEYLGYAPRHKIDAIVKKVPANDRTKLRKAGVRFAQYGVFVRDMLKPTAQKIKLILWALKNNIPLPELPPSGVVTIPFNAQMPEGYYDIAGYKICGDYAVRADMIEKLADAIRPLAIKSDINPTGSFEITAQHMSFIGKSGDAFDNVLKSLGYDYRQETVTVTSAKMAKPEIILPVSEVSEVSEVLNDDNSIISEVPPEISEEIIAETSEIQTSEVESDSSETVIITEKQIEKKIWFWSSVAHKPKKEFKKPYKASENDAEKPRFNNSFKGKKDYKSPDESHNTDNSAKKTEFKNSDRPKFKDKPKDNKENKKFTDKPRKDFRENPKNNDNKPNNQSSPYVNMPKTHKVAPENNPFAALLALKK